MASTLKITFAQLAEVGDYIYINIDSPTGLVVLRETFKASRQGLGEVTIAASTPSDNAIKYAQAWNLDYKNTGGSNNIVASVIGDEVTLTLANDSWVFNTTPLSSDMIGEAKITYVLNNTAVQPTKNLSFVDYDMVNSTCENVIGNFTAQGGNGTYNVYVDDVLTLSSQTANFSLNLTRGKNIVLRVVDTVGELIKSIYYRVPRKVIPNDLNIEVENFDSGATVRITDKYISADIYPLEYSLDNITYKTANNFTGIADGEQTLYVKDAFGCVTSKTFFVDGYTDLTETVTTVSNLNAIRYAIVDSNKKNHLNTLSCHENKQVRYSYSHLYTIGDAPKTQFKTNANYIDVFALEANGTKTPLTAIKQTDNTDKKIKTTATYFRIDPTKAALYFGLVDSLDYVTEAVIEQIDYGFSLPEWASEVGEYITIAGLGQVKIDDIQYVEQYDAFVLVFHTFYDGIPTEKIVSSQYNIQPYEVYEFEAPMVSLPEAFHLVIQTGFSAEAIQFTYLSERITRIEDSDSLFEINYGNSENIGDMVYQTGISHKLRIAGYVDDNGEQDTEGYDGDQEFYVTDNSIYDQQRFVFKNLTSEVARMMRGVVAHDLLTINGLSYKIANAPEITGNIMSNFKTFSVDLKRGGNVFLDSSQEIISGSSENEAIGGAIEASKGKSLILWTK